ncbi:recombinase family protein [Pseudomonas sp. NPDC089401]|uniref:recombinase family protein n=1 Tax=Pseudomonas sp. NPDC089401 TaxID=3364462 RepID=UPI00380CE8FE
MAKAKHIGYKRVSTEDQNTDRQLDGVALDDEFVDHASGGTTDRLQLAQMLRMARSGDTVHVHSIDRLARSLIDLEALVKELNSKGVDVKFHKESLVFQAADNGDDAGINTLMLQMLGAVAQFERTLIRDRQRFGIERAKREGKYKGRAKKADDARMVELKNSGMTYQQVADKMGVSVSTVQRALKGRS